MNEFDDFAASSRAEHDERQRARDRRESEEREKRDAAYNRGRDFLSQEAGPIIDQACEAFAKHGVRLVVKENWTSHGIISAPEISCVYHALKKRDDSSEYEISGPSVVARHDGDHFVVALSDNSYGTFGSKGVQGTDLEALKAALKAGLSKMFARLAPEGL